VEALGERNPRVYLGQTCGRRVFVLFLYISTY
jgi:hypothetical protein